MAKPKAKDAAQKYLEELLAKVPEEKRAAAKEALGVDSVLEDLGEHVLRQDEFSRLAAEAAERQKKADEKYAANVDWYNQNIGKLTQGELAMKKLEEEAAAAANRTAATDSTLEDQLNKVKQTFVPRDEAARMLQQVNAQNQLQTVDFVATLTDLSMKHYIDFKEQLDPRALLKYAAEKQKPLQQAYLDISAEKREAKQKAEKEAEIASMRKEIEAKVRAEASARGPYPTPDSSEGVSPLSGIQVGKSGNKSLAVDAAVKEYEASLFAH